MRRLCQNVRESMAATGLEDELRIIADKDVRECTRAHIGRIFNAVFEETPKASISVNEKYDSIGTAKHLGVVPRRVEAIKLVEGGAPVYYRISVKESTKLKFNVSDFFNRICVDVLADKEESIGRYDTYAG